MNLNFIILLLLLIINEEFCTELNGFFSQKCINLISNKLTADGLRIAFIDIDNTIFPTAKEITKLIQNDEYQAEFNKLLDRNFILFNTLTENSNYIIFFVTNGEGAKGRAVVFNFIFRIKKKSFAKLNACYAGNIKGYYKKSYVVISSYDWIMYNRGRNSSYLMRSKSCKIAHFKTHQCKTNLEDDRACWKHLAFIYLMNEVVEKYKNKFSKLPNYVSILSIGDSAHNDIDHVQLIKSTGIDFYYSTIQIPVTRDNSIDEKLNILQNSIQIATSLVISQIKPTTSQYCKISKEDWSATCKDYGELIIPGARPTSERISRINYVNK